jgi:3'-5' exoribonuclease
LRASAHHAFVGGLLEHTVAVAQMALELCAVHPRLDRDLLLCAALVHDLGKTREYAYGAEITPTEEGRMLGHVELGLRLIAAHSPPALSAPRRLALEHCVLTHHGDGAPSGGGRFASAEALALQRLNALDAGVKGAFEQGLGR